MSEAQTCVQSPPKRPRSRRVDIAIALGLIAVATAGVIWGTSGRGRDQQASRAERFIKEQDFSQAIELDGELAIAYFSRAAAYQGKGDLDRALSDWNQVVHLNPNLTAAHSNRATVFLKKGALQHALRDYDEAIRRDPKQSDAHV